MSVQTIRRYEAREEPPTGNRTRGTLEVVAKAANVSTEWLKTGQGEMNAPGGDGQRGHKPEKPEVQPAEDAAEQGCAQIFGEASAASGLILTGDNVERCLWISPERWHMDFGGVPFLDPEYGYWIARGDSAAPVYFDREPVPCRKLPEPTQSFRSEAIYIFRWHDDVYLKRLFRSATGIYAQSLNPAIPDLEFSPENGHDFAVLAGVCQAQKQQLYHALLGKQLGLGGQIPQRVEK